MFQNTRLSGCRRKHPGALLVSLIFLALPLLVSGCQKDKASPASDSPYSSTIASSTASFTGASTTVSSNTPRVAEPKAAGADQAAKPKQGKDTQRDLSKSTAEPALPSAGIRSNSATKSHESAPGRAESVSSAPFSTAISSAAVDSTSATTSSAATSVEAPTSSASPSSYATSYASSSASERSAAKSLAFAVTGSLEIAYGSRIVAARDGDLSTPAAHDTLKLDIRTNVPEIGETYAPLSLSGTITRQPPITSSILGRETQPARSIYRLRLETSQDVQMWNGVIDLGKGGNFAFSPDFRIARGDPTRGSVTLSTQPAGKLKPGQKFVRTVALKNLTLSPGPGGLPASTVHGLLLYDSDTRVWKIQRLQFDYSHENARRQDSITGSYTEERRSDWESSGKGMYRFNIRFNPNRQSREEDFFQEKHSGTAGEEAFFEEEIDLAGIFGTATIRDSLEMLGGVPSVTQSSIRYQLQATNLDDAQVANFIKLWILLLPDALESVR